MAAEAGRFLPAIQGSAGKSSLLAKAPGGFYLAGLCQVLCILAVRRQRARLHGAAHEWDAFLAVFPCSKVASR